MSRTTMADARVWRKAERLAANQCAAELQRADDRQADGFTDDETIGYRLAAHACRRLAAQYKRKARNALKT